ncbi:type II secretion system protein N [Hyphomonas johnsonii]|uniref:Type II secretion system protein N n=1 Tax=Hyphomonas johnsonii MHS-2 TaxID=1280950 RepID=A0A059FV13_9PROT|nr:type II secretion system protein N [Hyphomonas johnsonii]KCZ94298.1 general secretion pathway protein N [Hyphomonas johnsonii MHS-2]
MKRTLLILVFTGALIVGCVSSVPLSFVMRQTGITSQGVSWQQARGTIWHGQVTGLGFRGRAAGALDIRSSPASLLTGRIVSDVRWTSPAGRARGQLALGMSSSGASDLSAELDISRLDGLHPELRRTGGTLKVSRAAARFDSNGRCINAGGSAQLDLVRRLGVQYGRDWPLLDGTLTCTEGELQLPMSGKGTAGEQFDVTLRSLSDGRTGMDVHVSGLDPQANLVLGQIGFINTGNGYTLRQEVALVGEK